jgi:hypothetical protein
VNNTWSVYGNDPALGHSLGVAKTTGGDYGGAHGYWSFTEPATDTTPVTPFAALVSGPSYKLAKGSYRATWLYSLISLYTSGGPDNIITEFRVTTDSGTVTVAEFEVGASNTTHDMVTQTLDFTVSEDCASPYELPVFISYGTFNSTTKYQGTIWVDQVSLEYLGP